MRNRRPLDSIVLAFGLVLVVGLGTFRLLHLRRERQEASRLERAAQQVAQLRDAVPPCAAGEECGCDVPVGGAFTGCRVVNGSRALAIESNDACFTQWYAVEQVWPVSARLQYFGRDWVSRRPRQIAPGWSLLAVAPCVD